MEDTSRNEPVAYEIWIRRLQDTNWTRFGRSESVNESIRKYIEACELFPGAEVNIREVPLD